MDKIENILVDDSVHELSKSGKKARIKLLSISLLTIAYIVFQPNTPVIHLSQYFSINQNKQLVPVTWLLINFWLFYRYYQIIKMDNLVNTNSYLIFRDYFLTSPLKHFELLESRTFFCKYFDRSGRYIIYVVTVFEQIIFFIFKTIFELISSLFSKQEYVIIPEQHSLHETLEEHYMYGGVSPDIIEEMEDEHRKLSRYEEQMNNSNQNLFNADIKLPLVIGLVSMILIVFHF